MMIKKKKKKMKFGRAFLVIVDVITKSFVDGQRSTRMMIIMVVSNDDVKTTQV